MQKTCQPHQETTAASSSGRHVQGLKERPDVQDLSNSPTCSPGQGAMPGHSCTTRGLHLDSKRWRDRNYESVLREARSASRYHQRQTQARNSHDSEEVETDKNEVQPPESSKRDERLSTQRLGTATSYLTMRTFLIFHSWKIPDCLQTSNVVGIHA